MKNASVGSSVLSGLVCAGVQTCRHVQTDDEQYYRPPNCCQYTFSRHDNDMVRSRVHCEHQYHPQKRASGSGNGRGEQARVSNISSIRQSSASLTAAELVPRWSTSGEGLSNSASAPPGVGSASQDRAISASPENSNNKALHTGSKFRGKDCGRAANETTAISSRSESLGSSHSQARAQTVHSLRRSSSNASEAFGNGGGGVSSSNNSTSSAGVSVAASNDPDVLKVEIHRLQAALMNEFKGGNRFIGGAQFKASNNSRGGGHGGTGGNSCGGCLQVCECYNSFSFQFGNFPMGALILRFSSGQDCLLEGEGGGGSHLHVMEKFVGPVSAVA